MRVVIAGLGHEWERAVDEAGPDTELWGLNKLWKLTDDVDRFDLWVDIHRPSVIETRNPDQVGWLNEPHPFSVFVQDPDVYGPSAVRFPKDEINGAFPRGDYHCGSIDWMVALALYMEADAIDLYGVQFLHGEPHAARSCLEYWCGLAEGMGVEVSTPTRTNLFDNTTVCTIGGQYGYDHHPHWVPSDYVDADGARAEDAQF